MADYRNELTEGERILYQAKLHWVLFLGPAMLIVLGGLWIPAKGLAALVFVVIGLAWGVLSYRKYYNSYIHVTNKKVVICTSFLMKRPYRIPLADIGYVDFYQPSLGAILNFGKITIVHGDKYKSVFRMVSSPGNLVAVLKEQVALIPKNA
ncbi:MAG TPA: PH domain-containing protein [Syntrophorhabdus sp.]|jgi:hypothetical protein|nr:hypothetical protein [Syntrophorhabdus sp.]MDI9557664.1 PH domain-containing protein [Pseudomonadota bacterium]OPX96175.1 MAG: hypothetical protein A4E59_01319 [Syntrophorhabdus sp. PtaB.Bin027]OQB77288.1 MAG: hypothetical protein BWX92_01100 [Deltaproteobacteria bacterium ADurb.Bin135]NMC95052.1 hypothetical protein [Syntrophorhabdus sp.]